jgi:zinc protease
MSRLLAVLLAFTFAVGASAQPKQDPVAKAIAALYDEIREETLPNGLRLYLKSIPGAPTVCVMTTYRVGSADEELDQTGLSHYLEHLMFKGTEKLMPGDIDHITRRAGGQNNAYTTEDYTNFHFDLAADKWETALKIEADRMRNLRIDEKHEFQQEKGAVIAELDGNEDEPWELEHKAILPLLFGEKTPYGHPIIGERAHVKAATAEIIKSHYDKWYHPNNSSIVMVGGFDADAVVAKAKEMFGPIPAGKLPARKTVIPPKRAKPVHKETTSKFDAERLLMGFNTCKMGDPDDYVLDVIQHVLTTGKTGRLYRRLVLEQELAGEVSCANQIGRYPGWFSIQMEVMKGADRLKAEKALLKELELLAHDPVSEAELKRVTRNVIAGLIFQREDPHQLADSMVSAVAVADMGYLKAYLSRIQAVTPADIQRVARKYFDPDKRVNVWSIPEAKKEPGKANQQGSRETERSGNRNRRNRQKELAKPAGAEAVALKQTKKVVLPNGLILLLLEQHRLPIVYAEAYVGKVRLYEPQGKAGVAALVGLLLEEGTEKRSEKEISQAIENVGGSFAMSSTGGHVKVLSPDRELGLGLLLECLMRPAFQRDAVKRLKEHLVSEIQDTHSQPNFRAQEEFLKQIYGEHPLGRPANGTEESVDGLTAGDCRRFHQKVFAPNNTVLVLVGDFDTQTVINEVTALTKDWKKRDLPNANFPEPKLPDKFDEKIIPMETATQLNIYMGHPGIRRSDPDYYKLLVMDNILGVGTGFTDRLSSKLRDRQGLAYTVSASIAGSAGEEVGAFTGYIATYPDKFEVVKKGMIEEIGRMRTEKPTEQEVVDAKGYLLGTLPFRLVTNSDLAGQLLSIERHDLGFDYLEKFRQAINAVTADDVLAAAKKHLHPERMKLVAAGPIDEKGRPLKKGE